MEKEVLRYTVDLDRLVERLQELRRQVGNVPVVVGEPEGSVSVPGVDGYVPAKRALSLLECDVGVLHPSGSHATTLSPSQTEKAEAAGWTKLVLLTGWDGKTR